MGVFQYTEDTQLALFPWLAQHPAKLTSFLTLLGGWRIGRPQWFEVFPTEKSLFEGAKAETEERTLLVGVAGGHGYEIQAFRDHFPRQTGRLVLQKLPSVIDDIKKFHPELHPNIVRI